MPQLPKPKQYECRFCLQTDTKANLLAPCLCKGSYKYVHNKCLLEWFDREPHKGSFCNVCSFLYRQEYTAPKELWKPASILLNCHLYYPFGSIALDHWIIWTLFSFVGIPFTNLNYTLFQTSWHIFMFASYLHAVYRIQNRRAYAYHWQQVPRILLPVIHSYLLLTLPKTGIFGGVASNLCMMYYFYEHYEILDTMNDGIQIRFLSRLIRTS